MKQPSATPQITTLRKLVVNHKHIDLRKHVLHLSKWVRRIMSKSPLEHLELSQDVFGYPKEPHLNYRGLVEHVSHKHGGTIRILRLIHGYVDSAIIALLCEKCSNLEEASLGVNMITLVGLTSNHHFSVKTYGNLFRSPNSLERPPRYQSYDESLFGCATSNRPRSRRVSPIKSQPSSSTHSSVQTYGT